MQNIKIDPNKNWPQNDIVRYSVLVAKNAAWFRHKKKKAEVATMAGSGSGSSGGTGSSNPSQAPLPPKILLAKPGLVTGAPVPSKFGRGGGGGGGGGGEDDATSLRSRLPSIGSLNLLSDSWDFHIDRFLPVSTKF